MYTVDKKLLKKVFSDITLISKKFSEDTLVQVHAFEWFSIIYVTGSKDEIQYFASIIDYQVQFKAIEPAQRTLSFLSNAFKCLVLFLFFIWQLRMGVESIKEMPVHLPGHIILTKITNGTHTFFGL